MGNGLVVRFHEYNTRLEDGTPVTGHNLDGLNYAANSDAIYLENAGIYTYDNVIKGEDNWDAAAIAAQVKADSANIDPDAAYLVEEQGDFVAIVKGENLSTEYKGKTIRQANARGGFGEAVLYNPTATGIETVNHKSQIINQKFLKDGRLLIIRDNRTYNVLGAQL
jgi:hypothetical protein